MAEAPAKSIAVLPFENLSRDPDNAYFADGIQDEILTRLSKIADLKVISRTSTQKYKSAPDNLREIGQQLGVANLLFQRFPFGDVREEPVPDGTAVRFPEGGRTSFRPTSRP